MSAKLCIRTEEAAEGICTYRYEYKGRGFQMKKHVIAAVAAATFVTTAMSGCTGADTTAGGESVNGEPSVLQTEAVMDSTELSGDAAEDDGKVTLTVWAEEANFDVLQEMIDSFENKLTELYGDGVTYDVKNAQGDMSTLNSIASELKTADYDLVVPIVTPATQAVVNAGVTAPVVFISVTDPVAAGIMVDMAKPDKNATGTSNIVPVDEIFTLAGKLTPDVKNIGILYCSGEKNAVLTAEKAKTYLDTTDYTYEEVTVASSNEVQQAAQSLAGKVDAIYIPIDSTVQSAMAQVVEAANAAGIPIYGSDPVMVKSGALACVSVSNTQLGERSAEMAYDILNGKDVSEVPAEAMSDFQYVCSRAAADALSIALPEDGSVTVIGG